LAGQVAPPRGWPPLPLVRLWLKPRPSRPGPPLSLRPPLLFRPPRPLLRLPLLPRYLLPPPPHLSRPWTRPLLLAPPLLLLLLLLLAPPPLLLASPPRLLGGRGVQCSPFRP
jgi:hypothetical protein